MINKNLKKFKDTNIFIFLFLIIIFIPKIDLISIPGFWQGIRIEDVIIFFVGITMLVNKGILIFSNKKLYNGWFYFFIFVFFSNLTAIIIGLEIKFIMILRILEYLVLLIFFLNIDINKIFLKKTIKFYLILNLIVVFLQKFKLVGSFSSLGYTSAGNVISTSTVGILGGSWELAVISSLCFFILLYLSNKPKEKLLFFIITLYLIISSNSRMPMFGFIISTTFFYFFDLNRIQISNIKIKIYQIITILFLAILLFYIANFTNLKFIKFNLDYLEKFNLSGNIILKLLSDFVYYNEVPLKNDFHKYDFSYWSLLYRLEHWSNYYQINLSNPLSFFFGSGLNALYLDSMIIRIILNFGFIGLFFIALLSLRLPIFIFIFMFLSGLTLDLFVSMKIFIFTLLLILAYKNYAVNNRQLN